MYSSGDADHDGLLEQAETWVFTCSYVPPFNCTEPVTNTATVLGVWEDQVASDTASCTLYPCILHKDVLLYKGVVNVPYADPMTSFSVELSKEGVLLATFTINESTPVFLWLSQGTYVFTELAMPTGYLLTSQNVSFTTGVSAPEIWLSNVITFDLGIVKTGPVFCGQHDLIIYHYTVFNGGPASVTPQVVDDLCGVPVYVGGDSDADGLLDPGESWVYEATFDVTADPESLLTNIVHITDAEGAGGSWVLGGDRNPSNNYDSWSVQVLPQERMYLLSIEVVGNGSVVAAPHLDLYVNGSVVNLSALADVGWMFDHWEGDLNGSVTPAQLLMDSNKTVVAYFKEIEQQRKEYRLNVEVIGNGSVLRDPELSMYPNGTEVQLTAHADPGWVFDRWEGNLSGNETPMMLRMDGNKSVVAFFTMIQPGKKIFLLSVYMVGNGSVVRDPDQSMYTEGTVVTLTAHANAGWVFDHWSGNLSGNTSTRFLTMDANKSVWAYFVEKPEKTHPSSHGPPGHIPNSLPVADAGGPYEALLGEDLVLNGIGSHDRDGFIIHFFWSFGDGTTGTGATVVHRYLTIGTYQVTLFVVDNLGGSATNTTVAHIVLPNHPPSNPLITGPSEGVKVTEYSYSFSCSDPDFDVLSYRIDWGDWTTFPAGLVSSGESFVLQHRWESPGTYIITITASDGRLTASSTKVVRIQDTVVVTNLMIIVLNFLLFLVLILVYFASRRKMKHE